MGINRSKARIGDKFNLEGNPFDADIKNRLKHSNEDYLKWYHSLQPSEQRKLGLTTKRIDDQIAKNIEVENNIKNTTEVADAKMFVKRPGDRAITFAEFARTVKALHPNFILVPNHTVNSIQGEGEGHGVWFLNGEERYFVCPVGKAADFTIPSESVVKKVWNGSVEIEKPILHGWITACDNILNWMEHKGIKPRLKNKLVQSLT